MKTVRDGPAQRRSIREKGCASACVPPQPTHPLLWPHALPPAKKSGKGGRNEVLGLGLGLGGRKG